MTDPGEEKRRGMNCSNCGSYITGDSSFCPDCGQEMEERDRTEPQELTDDTVMYCPVCKKGNPLKNTFKCPGCGTEHLCMEHRKKIGRYDPDADTYRYEYYCTQCWDKYGFALLSE